MNYPTVTIPREVDPATAEAIRALLVAAGYSVHRSDAGYTLEIWKLNDNRSINEKE